MDSGLFSALLSTTARLPLEERNILRSQQDEVVIRSARWGGRGHHLHPQHLQTGGPVFYCLQFSRYTGESPVVLCPVEHGTMLSGITCGFHISG